MNHADSTVDNNITSTDESEATEVKDVKPVIIKSGRESVEATMVAPTRIKQEIKTEPAEYPEEPELHALDVSDFK